METVSATWLQESEPNRTTQLTEEILRRAAMLKFLPIRRSGVRDTNFKYQLDERYQVAGSVGGKRFLRREG
jgi:hypothetical protein